MMLFQMSSMTIYRINKTNENLLCVDRTDVPQLIDYADGQEGNWNRPLEAEKQK